MMKVVCDMRSLLVASDSFRAVGSVCARGTVRGGGFGCSLALASALVSWLWLLRVVGERLVGRQSFASFALASQWHTQDTKTSSATRPWLWPVLWLVGLGYFVLVGSGWLGFRR